jgi:hypothetical protein
MLTLNCETGNAAFGPDVTDRNAELARILRKAADRIEASGNLMDESGKLHDLNGNACGRWTLEAFDFAAHGEDNEPEDADASEVEEIACRYGRGTEANCFVLPVGLGAWYCVEGSQNVNFYHDADALVDGVDVEGLEDSDTLTAPRPINTAQDMANACRD